MTTLPVVPNVVKIKLGWTIGGDTLAENGLHWEYSGGPPSAADCLSIADTIGTAVNSHLLTMLGTHVTNTTVEVTDLSSMSGGVGLNETDGVGTRTGSPLPSGSPVRVNFQLTRRYRGGKSRIYLPAFTSTDLSASNTWLSASLEALATAWTAFTDAVTGASSGTTTLTEQVNVSYYQGYTNVAYGNPVKYRRVPTPRETPQVDAIVGASFPAIVGAQRRRNKDS
jgi:hypothetical protein